MKYAITYRLKKNPLKSSLVLLSLLFSQLSFAQHQHDASVKSEVQEVVNFVDNKNVLKAEICPEPGDRAFVNFDPKQLKDPQGFHGMLFFGVGDTFYISHLPMFHPPHDYQAIVEVKLRPEVKAKYLARLKNKGGYFTFAPEGNFILPEVVVKKSPIKGNLVQGHFERGGQSLLDTELELVRVVFYKKLNPKEAKSPEDQHIIFGKDNQYYLAHIIQGQPDRDEIIPVASPAVLSPGLKKEISVEGLAFKKIKILKGKVEIQDDFATKGPGKKPASFSYQSLYRETGDLE